MVLFVLTSCNKKKTNEDEYQFVDAQTPFDAIPTRNSHGSDQIEYELVFSDEFEDFNIDTVKWNVQNDFYRDRGDIKVYADGKQIEEKDGHLYIYYLKDPEREKAYLAGRIDSRGKYAPTYGFLESRMHFVKPNGHQTAFWMMPEGSGMGVPDGVDSTANDGAEIDIIEGNKANTYSCGLHWDGYGAAHRTNGQEIEVPEFHNKEYHIMGFEWNENYLRWYLDGEIVRELRNPKLIPKVPHFLYLSGSLWGESDWVAGNILKNEFIQNGGVDEAYVDYVRIFRKVTRHRNL